MKIVLYHCVHFTLRCNDIAITRMNFVKDFLNGSEKCHAFAELMEWLLGAEQNMV